MARFGNAGKLGKIAVFPHSFAVASRWFEGACEIPSYELDELLGTIVRALYQRRKSRDLFDLAIALEQDGVNPARIIEVFSVYLEHGGERVTRAQSNRTWARNCGTGNLR